MGESIIFNYKALKEMRIKNNMSVIELANKLGVNRSSIYYFEKNLRTPSLKTVVKMSEIFRCEIKELIK